MRSIALAIALSLATTASVAAQHDVVGPRGQVALFGGYSLGFSTKGDLALSAQGLGAGVIDHEQDGDGGAMFGAEGEYRFNELYSITGLFATGSWGEYAVTFRGGGITESDVVPEGLGLRMFRVGARYRIPEFPLVLSVSPGILRVEEKAANVPREFQDPINHWTLTFGGSLELPIGNTRFHLIATAEDMIVRWNTDEIESRYSRLFSQEFGTTVTTEYESSRSHSLALRIGVGMGF